MIKNRMYNMGNPAQGPYRRVLTVCSAGLLRSPTAAFVLGNPPFNFNTRAAGLSADFALVVVDEYLLHWADEVVCMSKAQKVELEDMIDRMKMGKPTPVICLDIDDDFEYRDPKLMKLIAKNYRAATNGHGAYGSTEEML
jgi:predicted protein tyrosine phosphatase